MRFEDVHEEPCKSDGLGFMEFYDWLAATSDDELTVLANDLPEEEHYAVLGALHDGHAGVYNREAAGLIVWQHL